MYYTVINRQKETPIAWIDTKTGSIIVDKEYKVITSNHKQEEQWQVQKEKQD